MSMWDEFDARVDRAAGGNFIALKDGEEIVGVFRGEPYFFYSRYQDRAHYKEWQENMSFKFQINFITKNSDGEWEAKILERGAKFAKQLQAVRNEYGLDHIYVIRRKGSDKKTEYSLLPKKGGELTPEQIAEIAKVSLNKLGAKGRSVKADNTFDQRGEEGFGDEEVNEFESDLSDEDVPF